uniref:Jacalin-type lectin domain-containing protein n=1 Tax=Oryza punctata TaxID=4537 RepID=A0A0E0MFL3_ORYPU
MEIVIGAIGTLLPKLTTLLMTDKYTIVHGNLRTDVMSIKAEFESMQAALERLSEGQITDKQVKIWMKDVKELSYDIEDSIDRFMVLCADSHSHVKQVFGGFLKRLRSLRTARIRHQIATDISDIKSNIKEVANRRDRYKIDSIPVTTATTIDPRLMGIYEEVTKLVGINGPREELAELLMGQEGSPNGQLNVISIVGVGGLGKTTLANVMYRQLRGQFECHAFVSISLKPDLKSILSSILRQVSGGYDSTENWGAEEIINKIRQVLEKKRYFIIIDDIWEKSAWAHIKCALPENNCSSRIITTSRIIDVAEFCCSDADGTMYKLKALSDDDSKKLFYKRIFLHENGCPLQLKEVSVKILKKCGGVPLAIITIASLLGTKPRNVHQWYGVYNSIGFGLENNPSVENMRQILSISYYDLPSHLKACLLYLSMYPEDYNIMRDQLVRRWISEGFIPGNDVDTLFKLGDSYLNELINRNIIQPEYTDKHGTVQVCRVHDMVLDFITSMSNEINFVTTLHTQQIEPYPQKIRRLSLKNSVNEQTTWMEAIDTSHARSLIVLPHGTKLLPPLSKFPVLRVLDMEGCNNLQGHQINGIGNLVHLRCVVLRHTNLVHLPKEIGSLGCLHTLDLRHTAITELPSTIVRLRQLVCLHIDSSVKLPNGIGRMRSLQALSFIDISTSPHFAKELGDLTELRILRISVNAASYESYEKPLVDSLCKLQKVNDVYIHACKLSTEFMSDFGWVPQHLQSFSGGQLSSSPRWINSSLLFLSTLDMLLDILRQEDLQTFGAMQSLQCLRFSVLKIEPEMLVVGTDHANFQCLTEFALVTNAMGLLFVKKAMPKLQKLELGFRVRDTKCFDLGLEYLHSLQHVTIRIDCRDSRIYEVDNAEATFQKAKLMNPNLPTIDVVRQSEDHIIWDKEKVLKEITEEDKELYLKKIGPWGGNGRVTFNIKVAPQRLESVTICSGTIIDALAFSYFDSDGKRYKTPIWGGVGGSISKINLGPSEFLVQVSGTVGPFNVVSEVITSLTLVTNVCSYGPFGQPQGTPFCTSVEKNNSIVGFFGQSGTYLNSVGVYLHPS